MGLFYQKNENQFNSQVSEQKHIKNQATLLFNEKSTESVLFI